MSDDKAGGDEHERPTKKMEPMQKIAKIIVDLENADDVAEFLTYVGHLLKINKRVAIYVQAEETDHPPEEILALTRTKTKNIVERK